jgi:hypothetical protein
MRPSFRFLRAISVAWLMLGGTSFAQWAQTGLPHGAYVSCFAAKGTNLFAGTDVGVYLSADSGVSWTPVNAGLTDTFVDAIAVSDTNLFCGTYGGGVFLSTNNGGLWAPVNNGLTNAHVRTLAAHGTSLFAGTWGAIFVSTNSGGNWVQISTGLTNTFVYALAASGTNLFAGTWEGVFLSADRGGTWIPVNSGLTNPWAFAFAVSGGNIFVGTYGGVFLSTNDGGSWAPVNAGLTSPGVLSLATSGANLFAGTYGGGVFLSTNAGTNWIPVNPGLGNTFVRAIAVSGTNLVAGTYFSGVWKSRIPDLFASLSSFAVNGGWNLVSVPRVPQDPGAPVLFPGASPGTVYRYTAGVFQQAAQVKTGEGYWALYDSAGTNSISGKTIDSASVTVPTGNRWVLIGSVTNSVPDSALTSSPAGAIVPGTLFGWDGTTYVHPATIEPGHGYWVLVNAPCTLKISSAAGAAARANGAAKIPGDSRPREGKLGK